MTGNTQTAHMIDNRHTTDMTDDRCDRQQTTNERSIDDRQTD